MKLVKPSWVNHDSKPIFSVDVHQGCLKFATGGQGMDSGRVVIWNLLPILSEKSENDESIPKMLCQMDNHLACVNCVRWSHNGKMLASASDDKLVMIWRMSKGPSGVFGTGGIHKNPESWKCIATLRGHSGDVLDLAWSPQDRWLASCSIDNVVIIWDVQAFPTIVAMLKGHTGLVKGVAWDPVGKFLASQSDDRSVKIWKTSDWTCSSTIKEPFDECGGTTHILRLSWSPDGQYLVSAHAMNSGGPTAQIIEREGWKCDKDVVGHRKAVTCVRFHTAILKRQAPKTNKMQQYCCWAVGSRDRSLSVWTTALQRPLVVVHELFNDSVLDISWGPEKGILMACSGDGTVACLQFTEFELGTQLSVEDKNILYQRIYGKSATLENGSGNGADLIVEIPELLFNKSQEKVKPPTLPIQANHNNSNIFERSIQDPTLIDDSNTNGCSFMKNNEKIFSVNKTPLKAIGKQTETRTADGKRRITPVFIPLNQDVSDRPSMISTSNSTTKNDSMSMLRTDSAPSTSNTDSTKSIITEAEQTRLDSRLVKSSSSSGTIVKPQEVDINSVRNFPRVSAKRNVQMSGPKVTSGSPYQASTSGPKIAITATTQCDFQKTALDHRIRVQNGNILTASGVLAKVTAFRLGVTDKLWEVYVGSPIVNLNFCTKYAMLCSLDGSIRLLNMKNGSPILPIITLTTAAIQCAFCPLGKYVGVITDCGILRIWDIDNECIKLGITCQEIFGKYGTVVQFQITDNAVPMILFSNGNSYSYSKRLQSWLVINTRDPIIRHGLQTTMPRELQSNICSYPLISLQACSNTFAPRSDAMDLNANNWQSTAKISFLENQIKICEAINSAEELKHWYAMLAFHITMHGSERRLRLFLDDLLGTTGDEKILTIPKTELLHAALDILKSQIKWQRLYVEYKELYENFKRKRQKTNISECAPNETDDYVMDFKDHNIDVVMKPETMDT